MVTNRKIKKKENEENDNKQRLYLKEAAVTLNPVGKPPTKNTVPSGSRSNKESVPGASPFWINFCSSVELWLGMVKKTFPCLPSLEETTIM